MANLQDSRAELNTVQPIKTQVDKFDAGVLPGNWP